MKKLILISVFVLGYIVIISQTKNIFHTIEPSLNYSFLGDKNIKSSTFNGPISNDFNYAGEGLNFGVGIKWLMNRKLNENNTIAVGLSYILTSYRYTFASSFFSQSDITLGVPLYFTHTLSSKFNVSIGTELQYSVPSGKHKSYSYVDSLSVVLNKPLGKIEEQYNSLFFIPLVIAAEYNIYTKKEKYQSIILYFKKGFQTISNVRLTEYNQTGQESSISTLNFKNTNITIGYRFYLNRKMKQKIKEREN